ncbi:hypothetical protein H9Q71_014320 [Fusarium xylarioides]|nr:hypothetical protein H9Q71_014320 [Fusarium xylarioides]
MANNNDTLSRKRKRNNAADGPQIPVIQTSSPAPPVNKSSRKAAKKQRKAEVSETPEPQTPTPPPKPEAKQEAEKSNAATTTRLSEQDRKALTNSGRAMFAAISSKAAGAKSRAALGSLRDLIQEKANEGICNITASGSSYMAVLYNNAGNRDAAVEALRGLEVTFGEDEKGKAVCTPFRETGKASVWVVPAGPFDTTETVKDAVMELNNKAYKGHKFEVYPIMEKNIPTGRYAKIVWDKEVEFCGKQIKINGQKRLVSHEPVNRCMLCKGNHSAPDCDNQDNALNQDDAVAGTHKGST